VVYTTKATDVWQPPFGDYLGKMTDELEKDYGPGAYATEFVATGPKSYTIKVKRNDEKTENIMKMKGFKSTIELHTLIDLWRMREMVREFIENRNNLIVVKVAWLALRKTNKHEVMTLQTVKGFKVTYDKRLIQEDATTLPRGY